MSGLTVKQVLRLAALDRVSTDEVLAVMQMRVRWIGPLTSQQRWGFHRTDTDPDSPLWLVIAPGLRPAQRRVLIEHYNYWASSSCVQAAV